MKRAQYQQTRCVAQSRRKMRRKMRDAVFHWRGHDRA
jgi:hypothetical protein